MSDIRKIGIPSRYIEAETDLPVESYYIYGDVGTGKTHTAAALALKANVDDDTICVRFYSMAKLYEALMDFDNPFIKDVIKNCNLLVLDDIGKEKMTEWKYEQMFGIIDHRYSEPVTPNGKPRITIITSNLSLPELAKSYGSDINGKSIASRIYDICKPLDMGGKDRRLG